MYESDQDYYLAEIGAYIAYEVQQGSELLRALFKPEPNVNPIFKIMRNLTDDRMVLVIKRIGGGRQVTIFLPPIETKEWLSACGSKIKEAIKKIEEQLVHTEVDWRSTETIPEDYYAG